MVPSETTRRDSFVVRIWHEGAGPGWNGWVQHTAAGESTFFRRWDELVAFLERWVEGTEAPVQTGLR